MDCAASLRRELGDRAQQIAAANKFRHELTAGEAPSVIFGCGTNRQHGNFYGTSYKNICANPGWKIRLSKVHTAYRKAAWGAEWQWKELDCANSSDALLMNIFCYRRRLRNQELCSRLGVAVDLVPQFGFKPRIPLRDGKADRTEIDMKLGDLLVEAKLTESGFQNAPARLVKRYRDFEDVFQCSELPQADGYVPNYQLIRGALAAHSTGGSFCVMCDARRPDLIESWYSVMRAVKDCSLRCRLQLLTWQEVAITLPKPLQRFLAKKYGIRMPE